MRNSDKNAAMPEQTTHTTVRYNLYEVIGDGDCGFTAFGITREQAIALLKENCKDKEVVHLITPLVKEALAQNKFREYCNIPLIMPLTKEELLRQHGNNSQFIAGADEKEIDDDIAYQCEHNKKEIISDYIAFDLEEKSVDSGFVHMKILRILAYIQKINLYIWEFDKDGNLKPRSRNGMEDCDYSYFECEGAAERKDLLYVGNNHFNSLSFVDESDQPVFHLPANAVIEKGNVYPLDIEENALPDTNTPFDFENSRFSEWFSPTAKFESLERPASIDDRIENYAIQIFSKKCKSVDLTDLKITTIHLRTIMNAISTLTPEGFVLKLEKNNLDDSAAKVIAKYLTYKNKHQLYHINYPKNFTILLGFNVIRDAGAIAIATALRRENNQSKITIDLQNNMLGTAGFTAFLDLLKSGQFPEGITINFGEAFLLDDVLCNSFITVLKSAVCRQRHANVLCGNPEIQKIFIKNTNLVQESSPQTGFPALFAQKERKAALPAPLKSNVRATVPKGQRI